MESPQRNAAPTANNTPNTIFFELFSSFSVLFSILLGLSLELKKKTLDRIKNPPISIEIFSLSPNKIKPKGYTNIKLNCVRGNAREASIFSNEMKYNKSPMVTDKPEIRHATIYSVKFWLLNKKIDVKEPNNRERRNVEHDTKTNRKSKLGFDSILPKLNLYTNEATPHVIKASKVKIYPINSAINLKLLNIALKLF
jgi:hypothetical protein